MAAPINSWQRYFKKQVKSIRRSVNKNSCAKKRRRQCCFFRSVIFKSVEVLLFMKVAAVSVGQVGAKGGGASRTKQEVELSDSCFSHAGSGFLLGLDQLLRNV